MRRQKGIPVATQPSSSPQDARRQATGGACAVCAPCGPQQPQECTASVHGHGALKAHSGNDIVQHRACKKTVQVFGLKSHQHEWQSAMVKAECCNCVRQVQAPRWRHCTAMSASTSCHNKQMQRQNHTRCSSSSPKDCQQTRKRKHEFAES